mmetsp:Transcript_69708/g.167344  ORF Transcript_69708/g.167344 Transcript_69708/m.167344 type:complete len:348 (+) Transcript_69708:67-1110(+)
MPPAREPTGATVGAMQLRRWELPYGSGTSSKGSESARLASSMAAAQKASVPVAFASMRTHHESTLLTPSRDPQAEKAAQMIEVPLDLKAAAAEYPSQGVTLPRVEREKHYGSLHGSKVEAELNRLSMIVKGIIRDLACVKDTVWHLEDDVQQWQDVQSSEINEFRSWMESADKRLTDLGSVGPPVRRLRSQKQDFPAKQDFNSDELLLRVSNLEQQLKELVGAQFIEEIHHRFGEFGNNAPVRPGYTRLSSAELVMEPSENLLENSSDVSDLVHQMASEAEDAAQGLASPDSPQAAGQAEAVGAEEVCSTEPIGRSRSRKVTVTAIELDCGPNAASAAHSAHAGPTS